VASSQGRGSRTNTSELVEDRPKVMKIVVSSPLFVSPCSGPRALMFFGPERQHEIRDEHLRHVLKKTRPSVSPDEIARLTRMCVYRLIFKTLLTFWDHLMSLVMPHSSQIAAANCPFPPTRVAWVNEYRSCKIEIKDRALNEPSCNAIQEGNDLGAYKESHARIPKVIDHLSICTYPPDAPSLFRHSNLPHHGDYNKDLQRLHLVREA